MAALRVYYTSVTGSREVRGSLGRATAPESPFTSRAAWEGARAAPSPSATRRPPGVRRLQDSSSPAPSLWLGLQVPSHARDVGTTIPVVLSALCLSWNCEPRPVLVGSQLPLFPANPAPSGGGCLTTTSPSSIPETLGSQLPSRPTSPVSLLYLGTTSSSILPKAWITAPITPSHLSILCYQLVDVSLSESLLQEMRDKVGKADAVPPQIFNGNEYCGDFEMLYEATENEEVKKFLK
ncbi:hypothetical protein E2320_012962, partial [Naja naja]